MIGTTFNNSDMKRAISIFDRDYKNCEIISVIRDDNDGNKLERFEYLKFIIEFYDRDKEYIASTTIKAIPASDEVQT